MTSPASVRPTLPLFLLLLSCIAVSQVTNSPSSQVADSTSLPGYGNGARGTPVLVQSNILDSTPRLPDSENGIPLRPSDGSVSVLDLKAPIKARREFEKGYRFLNKMDLHAAVQHFTAATAIYPKFVSAINALGSSYLALGQNDQARENFARAIALDGHLPGSYFNLGCTQLALKQDLAAVQSIKKASTISPLNIQVLTALAYGQYMSQDFAAVVKTSEQVHSRRHDGAAIIHFYAAAAWKAQQNYSEAQRQLETLLREDPNSPAAERARKMTQELQEEAMGAPVVPLELRLSYSQSPDELALAQTELSARKVMQDSKENSQIAEAEAQAACPNCGERTIQVQVVPPPPARPARDRNEIDAFTLRASAK